MNIGIIGTAGRGDDYAKLDLDLFVEMHEAALKLAEQLSNGTDLHLISGGAGWADHIAVSLYIAGYAKAGLTLHLPAKFENNEFVGGRDASTDNYYHEKFSRKCYPNETFSREFITLAIKNGAHTTVSDGFIARNALVARDSDYLIALTFGNKGVLKRGGTSRTMEMFLAAKNPENAYHICLPELQVYKAQL